MIEGVIGEIKSAKEFSSQSVNYGNDVPGYSLTRPGRLSEAVRKLSDHYIGKPGDATPWNETWAQAAYLAYFYPLNWARAWSVVDEGRRHGFFNGLKSYIDFGSGVSPFSHLLKDIGPGSCVEISNEARELHKRMSVGIELEWTSTAGVVGLPSETLAIFSYVLTEVPAFPKWALDCEAILIVEPSTRQDGRRLQTLRNELQKKGFHIYAPCTHAGECPLLKQSNTDWCHDRIHFEAPTWFEGLEKLLPMRNRTITFSYLLARKTPPAKRPAGLARITGDVLEEKGKTRQLVCRGEEREFLSWLHRDGPSTGHNRGSLVILPENLEVKGNELRAGSDQPVALVRKLPTSL
ncbi:MAG: small ribosomal subunit Rsm22 family protein [Bdellovibrionia bacterium]